MAAITAPYPTVEVKLPAPVIEEGLASREQLETLIYAMNAHAQYLDTRWRVAENKSIAFGNDDTPGEFHRQGFFIGHGTGCGKGLICALIILANWCEGRKKAIWLSKNETLIEDARRDWQRLGGKPTQIVPLSKYKLGEPIGLNEGILFVTYGGLRTPGKNGKKSRLEQILDWVGADFQGSISLNESHLLGNCAGEENERGRTNASAQGLAGTHLIDRLPHARVTYLSATGAAKVSSLAYCQRLGLWMTQKFPFKSREEFLNQLGNAGVAALEILAQDLKRLGLYTACTLSFDGVKFETLTHHLTAEQRKIWDIYARAFQIIHTNINAAFTATNINSNGKCLNARAKSVALSAFEGMKQRFFNQLLCAAKAPTLIDAIEGDLAAERSCVIQLVSTNEAILVRAASALLNRQLAQIPTAQWGDLRAMDFSSKNVVCDYLYHAFPIHLYLSYVDEEGTTRSELAQDDRGEPIVSQEALAIRDRLLEDIALLPPMTGLLDQLIWHFGHDRVAEVTGRSKRVIYRDNRYQLATRSTNANIAETHSFQSGQKRILIFSNAGGTGRSYHADLGCINQQLRRHYLVEAGWEAISAVQGFGRSHRSNQQQPPEVVLVTTDVKGELRFTATIASRLSSLGAISKGQSSTGNNGLFQEELNDFSSKYAKYALAELFSDLHGGTLDLTIGEFETITGLNLTTESGGLLEDLPSINRFMNRLLALPIEQQNYLFTEFATRMQERIDRAKANGTYERGMETLYSPLGFEIADTKTLSERTTCYSIDKLSPPRILTPAETREMVLEGYRYCRHRKDSTQVAIAKTDDIRINRKGEVVDTVQIRYPVGSKAAERLDLTQFESKWEILPPDEGFWQSWQTAIDKAPKLIKERFYLICGLLLPHWRKFPAFNPKVYRLKTNDGRVLLGRAIEPADIAGVLTNFGVDAAEIIDASSILATVLEGNRSYRIGSKYHLCRTYFKGGEKLEIADIYDRGTIQWLTSIGCLVEMVDWKMRVFIPHDLAIEIIDLLLADAR